MYKVFTDLSRLHELVIGVSGKSVAYRDLATEARCVWCCVVDKLHSQSEFLGETSHDVWWRAFILDVWHRERVASRPDLLSVPSNVSEV